MRSESDAGCEQEHGPVNPFGIKPRQSERRQRREHQRENSTVRRAGKRRTHACSIQDSDGFHFTLLHVISVPLHWHMGHDPASRRSPDQQPRLKTTTVSTSLPMASAWSSGDQAHWVMPDPSTFCISGSLVFPGCQTTMRPSIPPEASRGPACWKARALRKSSWASSIKGFEPCGPLPV